MTSSIEDLLGVGTRPKASKPQNIRFSCLFFSDVRKDITDAEKYRFLGDVTRFADRTGFEAVYFPERHFHEFGSIFANPAIVAAQLIPQTKRIRFRTAGVTVPLHHPAEIVEWWAMNDVLSGGRVDLGFGSGWAKGDFIYAPENFEDRRKICSDGIETIRRLWRGEKLAFEGSDGEPVDVTVYPRPIQSDLTVWLLITQNEEAFIHAGKMGYNVFTMLYGTNLNNLSGKIALYRAARQEAGHDPDGGIVTLTLHTLVLDNQDAVLSAIETPFRSYIQSSLNAHVDAGVVAGASADLSETDRAKMLDYAYQRYVSTGALFGTPNTVKDMVDQVIASDVDEIACLMDFGVDYDIVRSGFSHLARLAQDYGTTPADELMPATGSPSMVSTAGS
jgi:natural product biosynthesis luciferase-like monooxygenase protein